MNYYFIGDNHFGSKEVIKIFSRPFSNVEEMDKCMIDIWNQTIKENDTIFILGDFTYYPDDIQKYAKVLNGKKVFIWGNHDCIDGLIWYRDAGPDHLIFEYNRIIFYIVHRPEDVPYDWKQWAIHGHHHLMPQYPFIDGKYKNINVACERIGYRPVSIDWILSLDIDTILRMETITSRIIRKNERKN